MAEVTLHNYFRSSAAYRVRIALAIKAVPYRYEAVHLRRGEQGADAYLALNPQGLVPTLVWSDGRAYSQSMAIIEFLDEEIPEPPLLPGDAPGRARVRALSQMIACEVHPLNNLRVLNTLRRRFGASDAEVADWFRLWAATTFAPLERRLAGEAETGRFCHGHRVTMADLCLVPQVANNTRFDVDMAPYPTIRRINEACLELEAFRTGAPAAQPDAE